MVLDSWDFAAAQTPWESRSFSVNHNRISYGKQSYWRPEWLATAAAKVCQPWKRIISWHFFFPSFFTVLIILPFPPLISSFLLAGLLTVAVQRSYEYTPRKRKLYIAICLGCFILLHTQSRQICRAWLGRDQDHSSSSRWPFQNPDNASFALSHDEV